MQNRKIRILMVEDSRFFQAYLRKVLGQETCFEIAGVAETGAVVRDMVRDLKPDVITLDLNLPDVLEFELLKDLLAHTDIPVIVVSSQPRACEEAIRLGAADFMEKLTDANRFSAEQFSILLRLKIKMQTGRLGRGVPPELSAKSETEAETADSEKPGNRNRREAEMVSVESRNRKKAWPSRQENSRKLIAIGASVGGTESTLELLRELPENMPGILVVQHMPVGFTRAYAMRLDQNCRLKVTEAKDGDRVMPGQVLVAESGRQLTVAQNARGFYVRSRPGPKISGFCPSVDALFSSIAETQAQGAAVILTGMGRDGVEGIGRLHEKGFYTVGQEKESCAVFGMPKAAYEAQALDELLDPQQIAKRLIRQYKL